MGVYIGLDVSQRQTAICVVDDSGRIIVEGKASTLPQDIHAWLIFKNVEIASIVRVGLEAGAMSSWLHTELSKLGLPMLCLEAYQAHRFLKTNRNKNDKNDARGLAQLVRIGGACIRPAAVRAQATQQERLLLTLRQNLVRQKLILENTIAGSFKPFGILIPRGRVGPKKFLERVAQALLKTDELGLRLREAVSPSLVIHEGICQQLTNLTKRIEEIALSNPVCQRLMTVPGVGPIVALSFVTAVENPARFARTDDIGAYFGLTPRQYQSGETDRRDGISRLGNSMTRSHLVQAATVLLSTCKKWSSLRAWGMKIAKRRGFNKARIAVARKLAIILHRMWIDGKDFCWSKAAMETELAGTMPA